DAGLSEILDRGLPLQLEEQGGGRVRDLPGVGRPPGPRQTGGDQAVNYPARLVETAAEVGQGLGAERIFREDGGGDPPLEQGAQGLDDLRGPEAEDGQRQQVGIAGIAVAVAQGVLDGLADYLLPEPAAAASVKVIATTRPSTSAATRSGPSSRGLPAARSASRRVARSHPSPRVQASSRPMRVVVLPVPAPAWSTRGTSNRVCAARRA